MFFNYLKTGLNIGKFQPLDTAGMRRLIVGPSDGKDDLAAAQDVMVSAYTDASGVPVRMGLSSREG